MFLQGTTEYAACRLSVESKREKYEPHVGQSYGDPHFVSKLEKTKAVVDVWVTSSVGYTRLP